MCAKPGPRKGNTLSVYMRPFRKKRRSLRRNSHTSTYELSLGVNKKLFKVVQTINFFRYLIWSVIIAATGEFQEKNPYNS